MVELNHCIILFMKQFFFDKPGSKPPKRWTKEGGQMPKLSRDGGKIKFVTMPKHGILLLKMEKQVEHAPLLILQILGEEPT
jgi:hypothetical protein